MPVQTGIVCRGPQGNFRYPEAYSLSTSELKKFLVAARARETRHVSNQLTSTALTPAIRSSQQVRILHTSTQTPQVSVYEQESWPKQPLKSPRKRPAQNASMKTLSPLMTTRKTTPQRPQPTHPKNPNLQNHYKHPQHPTLQSQPSTQPPCPKNSPPQSKNTPPP